MTCMEIENVIDTTQAILPCEHNHGTSYDYEGRVAICRACGKPVPQSERRDYNVQLREWQRYV